MISGIAIVSKYVCRVLKASLVIGVVVFASSTTRADVVGEQVVYGDVTFTRQGRNLFIHASNNSIINYQSFNIGIDDLVQFFQPGADSRVLNRILGPDPTSINGTLLANGRVYFANPAGVIFGNGSVINVGGIYAAAGNITDANFLSGIDQFQISTGSVINYGSLRGEAIHLIGRHVANHGQIIAPQGIVTMLAGDSVFIGEIGGNLLVRIDGRNFGEGGLPSAGQSSPDLNALAGVENTGSISSDQGNIVIGAGDLYSLGIHNIGALHAAGGSVSIQAADGAVHNQGVISTSSLNGDAGSILVQGPSILNEGQITADSDSGNAGSIEITSQNHTYLAEGSLVSASGLSGFSNGGSVLIHSYDGYTFFSSGSLIDVSGGASGGYGGFAEVSGSSLTFAGDVNLWSSSGFGRGTLLIDPIDLQVVLLGADDGLLGGNSVTFNEVPGVEPATISASSIEALSGTIILEATNDISILEAIAFNPNDVFIQNLILRAGNDISFEQSITGADSLVAISDFDFSGMAGPASDGVGNISFMPGVTLASISISLQAGTGAGAAAFVDFTNATFHSQNIGDVALSPTSFTWGQDASIDTSVGTALTAAMFDGGVSGLTLALNSLGGDVAINNGSLVADTDLTLVASNDVAINVALSIANAVRSLDVTAGNSLSAASTLTAMTGNINLTGATITLADDATATLGALAITGPTSASGNLSAGTNLTLNNAVTFDSAGAQSATAGGTLLASGTLTKAANDLALSGATITLATDATATLGALAITGPTSASGNLSAGTNLTLNNAVTFDSAGAQSATAGGTLLASGILTKGTNDLALSGTTVSLANDATATLGALAITGPTSASGNLSAGTNLTLNNAVTFDSGAAQSATAGGTLLASGTLTKAANDLALSGTTVTLANDATATLGALAITGPTSASGNLSAGTNLNLNDSVTFDSAASQSATAGGTLTANGSLTKGTNNLALTGTSLVLGDGLGTDNVTVSTGSLIATGNTTLDLNGGSITTGLEQTYQNALTLLSAANLNSTGSGDIRFESSIDGGFDFNVLNNAGNLIFNGEIGQITALNSFTAGINPSTSDLILFNATMLITDNDIVLNNVGRSDVPTFATIAAPNGGMTFQSNSGNFLMGQNEKMTIFGNLNIMAAAGIATLGDLNTLNDMNVTALQIQLRTRDFGQLLDVNGFLDTANDLGVDYVTGGVFNFSVSPVKLGGGNAFFASETGQGDGLNTLGGFTMQSFGETILAADLLHIPLVGEIIYLDLKSDGPTNANVSEALAAAIPRASETEAVPQETPVGSTELQRLRDLGINARRLLQNEYILNATLGLSVFNDSRSDVSEILEVTDKRLLNDRVRQVVVKYDELVGSGEEPGDDRRARIRDLLIQARADFLTSGPDLDLSPGAMRTLLRDPKYREARDYFDLLTILLNDVKLLGLTNREYRDVETYLLKDIESTFLDTDYLRKLLLNDPGLRDDQSILPDDSK